MSGHRTTRNRREWRIPVAYGHGPVFALGMGVLMLVGAATAGLTWASGGSDAKPVADVSPLPSTAPGDCTLLVGTRLHSMDVDRARTLTMIAGVGTQVGAIPQQTARAFDIALANRAKYLPNVTTTLTLLAQDDTVAATPLSLAEVAAVAQPDALSCTETAAASPARHLNSDGLTPQADALKAGVQDAFGKLQMAGTSAAQAPAGTALTVSLAPISSARLATGWVLAGWLVARESSFDVARISFAGHHWQPADGWNSVATAPSPAVSAGGRSPLDQAAAAAALQAGQAQNPSQLQIVVG